MRGSVDVHVDGHLPGARGEASPWGCSLGLAAPSVRSPAPGPELRSRPSQASFLCTCSGVSKVLLRSLRSPCA